jgi:hypothetical protein
VSSRWVECQIVFDIIAEVTQHGVRLALAEEDATNLQCKDNVEIHDDISPAMLISIGLKLESLL